MITFDSIQSTWRERLNKRHGSSGVFCTAMRNMPDLVSQYKNQIISDVQLLSLFDELSIKIKKAPNGA